MKSREWRVVSEKGSKGAVDGGGEKLAGVHGSGDSGHPNRNRTHEKDLQAITNSLGYRNGDGGHIGVAFRGGAMGGDSSIRCYGVLGCHLTI